MHLKIASMTPSERAERNFEKRRRVLAFLRREIWTTAPVLRLLLDADGMVATQDVMSRLLRSLEREGLIVKEQVLTKNVVGITLSGQAAASEILDEEFVSRAYEKGRVSFATIPHREALHRSYILLAKAGWHTWQFPDRAAPEEKSTGKYRPGAISTSPDGTRVALEIELSVKTRKRYSDVVAGHLANISAGDYSRVVYLTQFESHRKAIENLILGIDRVIVNGREVAFNDADRGRFSFHVLDNNIGSIK
jgi:DNA-binding MarR family transcriptional regulator